MSPVRMSRIEKVVRIALAYKDTFNRRDIEGMLKLMSDDCEFETAEAPGGVKIRGKQKIEQYWRDFMSRRLQIHMVGEEVNGLGMRCILRWRLAWKDTDDNERFIRGVDIFEVEKGLICKQYSYTKAIF